MFAVAVNISCKHKNIAILSILPNTVGTSMFAVWHHTFNAHSICIKLGINNLKSNQCVFPEYIYISSPNITTNCGQWSPAPASGSVCLEEKPLSWGHAEKPSFAFLFIQPIKNKYLCSSNQSKISIYVHATWQLLTVSLLLSSRGAARNTSRVGRSEEALSLAQYLIFKKKIDQFSCPTSRFAN